MNYATHPAWPAGDGWITPSDRAILARAPRPVPLRASLLAWCAAQVPAWESEALRLMKIVQEERAWAERATGVQRDVALATADATEKRAAMLYESACRWSS